MGVKCFRRGYKNVASEMLRSRCVYGYKVKCFVFSTSFQVWVSLSDSALNSQKKFEPAKICLDSSATHISRLVQAA